MVDGERTAVERPATPYAWYALGVLVLVYAFNFIDRQILSILANDVKRDLHVGDDFLGFLYGTAFGVFYSLFGIPLGRLADSWKRVRLMSLGLVLWSGMTALSGFARNGAMLTGARIGVGVGEATASPSAYSLLSDWFPKRQRATALAIYSAGLYIGGGLSLGIGGAIVGRWNASYPNGGPLGLVGWQAAFVAVGLPGLLLALWVASLKEPPRGLADGIPQAASERPFAGFLEELVTIIPPFTLLGAARRGTTALLINIGFALLCAAVAGMLIVITKTLPQWLAFGTGVYAVFSWASALRVRDPATFRLIWGTPAFLQTSIGYGLIALVAYALAFWAAPYAERTFHASKFAAGLYLGGGGAAAGLIGVVIGGRVADAWRRSNPAGRVGVVLFGSIAPVLPVVAAYTTRDATTFYVLSFVAGVLGASALGAAAATTQDLVLPRMRGTATATFFLANALLGLSLGPPIAGIVSKLNHDNIAVGVLATLLVAPISITLLILAWRSVPRAEATVIERAQAAGEIIPD